MTIEQYPRISTPKEKSFLSQPPVIQTLEETLQQTQIHIRRMEKHDALARYNREKYKAPGLLRYTFYYRLFFFEDDFGIFSNTNYIYKIKAHSVGLQRPGELIHICAKKAYLIEFTFSKNQWERVMLNDPHLLTLPDFMYVPNFEAYKANLEEMLDLFLMDDPLSNEYLQLKLKDLLFRLILQQQKENQHPDSSKFQTMLRITKYIDQHYTEDLNIQDIGETLHLHPNYIHRLFKELKQMTPVHYITSKRLALAQECLLSTDAAISEIAETCGFSSASYFSSIFKKYCSMTPNDFRDRYQNSN